MALPVRGKDLAWRGSCSWRDMLGCVDDWIAGVIGCFGERRGNTPGIPSKQADDLGQYARQHTRHNKSYSSLPLTIRLVAKACRRQLMRPSHPLPPNVDVIPRLSRTPRRLNHASRSELQILCIKKPGYCWGCFAQDKLNSVS
ncbi:hypothetical protein BKA56DRAFT_590364 [Ilyonectria sp. MPI-CAGE-AT-0026]|nr:hypothetical protein BKA56DRAFT_590364 [Ilyonectria sp. MPI-CAGE-AT-0026]